MPRSLARFVLTTADQARVDLDSLSSHHDRDDPNRMRIVFELDDASGPAPAVVPPFPGLVFFVPDPDAIGDVPTVQGGVLVPGVREDWRRTGSLLVVADRQSLAGMGELDPPLAVTPNTAWVGPVELPTAFFDAFDDPTLFPRQTLVRDGATIGSADPAWSAHAVAGFLAGTHGVRFTHHESDPAQDTIARLIAAAQAPLAVATGTGIYAVDSRFALHAGAMNPAADPSIQPTGADDGRSADLAGTGSPTDPGHPTNGAVSGRYLWQRLQVDMLDGDGLVAQAVINPSLVWRPFRVRMWSPSTTTLVYGRLAGMTYSVEQGIVVEHETRPLPHHGTVMLYHDPDSQTAPERTFTLDGTFSDDLLAIECTRFVDYDPPGFDVAVDGAPSAPKDPQVVLLPDIATTAEFNGEAVADCFALMSSARLRAAMADIYATEEARIGQDPYPSSWDQDKNVKPTTFHGARRPWAGIRQSFLDEFFEGVEALTITTDHPPIRPADIFNCWLMEGLFLMIKQGRFEPLFLPPLASWFWKENIMGQWSDEAAVKTAFRVGIFFRYCGLDSFNSHGGAASDNAPTLDGNSNDMKTAHDGAFNTYRGSTNPASGILGRGVSCPTIAEFHDTFSVSKGKLWLATPGSGYTRTLTHLIAAVFLDHQMRFIANLQSYGIPIAADEDLPEAFRYMSYNAGPGAEAAPGDDWQTVDTSAEGFPSSLRWYIDGYRAMDAEPGRWPTLNDWLAKDRISVNEESRSSGGTRTNAIHFWLLSRGMGAAFPWKIPDLP